MNKIIIISDKIRGYLQDIDLKEFTASIETDIPARLDSLLHNNTHIIYVVLFMHADDLTGVAECLNKIQNPNFHYSMVFFDPQFDPAKTGYSKSKNISSFCFSKITQPQFNLLANKAFSDILENKNYAIEKNKYLAELGHMKLDQEHMVDIGRALSMEKDPDKLFRLILMLSKKITGADAGSIFIVEQAPDGVKRLRFKYSHTFSKDLPYEEFVMPLDTNSIAGYVAVTGNVLNIPDAYKLSKEDPVSFNSSFDKDNNYRSKSMLVIPMKNHIDETIGVIQLINSKVDADNIAGATGNEAFEIKLETSLDFEIKVIPFAERDRYLTEAIASQAAIAIENNRMINQIQNQFEEFVKASVAAIESRDAATSGHSFRVAEISKQMAFAINEEKEGYYGDIYFSEIAIKELEFAALLHDFGKVYIDISIFQKSHKLYLKEFENLMLKLDYLYRYCELQSRVQEIELLHSHSGDADSQINALKARTESKLKTIKKIKEMIRSLNEPKITDNDPEQILQNIVEEIKEIQCLDPDGNSIQILTDNEMFSLKTRRGSLNPSERKEIENHVIHTYTFVSKIPWPPEFKNIPEIALKHHEKLDGSGYPNNLKGEASIPIEARIIAVADIFDALAAKDRPYKKSVPLEKSLEILQEEGDSNKLDKELVRIFLKNRIYEKFDSNSFKGDIKSK